MSFRRIYRPPPQQNLQSGFLEHHEGDRNSSGTLIGSKHQRRHPGDAYSANSNVEANGFRPLKRRRPSSSASNWDNGGNLHWQPNGVGMTNGNPYWQANAVKVTNYSDAAPSTSSNMLPYATKLVAMARQHAASRSFRTAKLTEPVKLAEDEDPVYMSRDEIERCSPSRKDGIDVLRETHLRYSYCMFLQNLGMRLDLPQTSIGTAMVLCHRFFFRRSHACHDRFLIATAALFLAAKSEETPCPLNNVVRASSEICHKQNLSLFPCLLPVDWFEKYRERVIEAETLILTTLDFELNVQHPYAPLTSVLNKFGLAQTVLVNLASNLISEGLRSSLWLQFKPHHIAAGAAFLAARILNFDLSFQQSICQEFQTTPSILQDVVQQLMELF